MHTNKNFFRSDFIMEIKKICVIGGGLMGRQIGLCAAIHGVDATVYDLNPDVLAAVQVWEDDYLAGRIAKGRMTEEQVADIRTRYHLEPSLEKAVAGVDLVIEAIVEDKEIKSKVLKNISEITADDTIIATNSSVMVSSLFADAEQHPERLCNVHYY